MDRSHVTSKGIPHQSQASHSLVEWIPLEQLRIYTWTSKEGKNCDQTC